MHENLTNIQPATDEDMESFRHVVMTEGGRKVRSFMARYDADQKLIAELRAELAKRA